MNEAGATDMSATLASLFVCTGLFVSHADDTDEAEKIRSS